MHLRRTLLTPYHFLFAVIAACWYGFPARKLTVIGVTGTKGKSSVTEMLHAVLTAAGYKTALASTIRFAIGAESKPNLYKMTLPGRGFIQKFLAKAVKEGATHAVVELTSEAALQYRHLFVDLDALIFTNLHKEHIESHGSYEKYFKAKFKIGLALARSRKRPRAIIANADDEKGQEFLKLSVEEKLPFSLKEAEALMIWENGSSFTYKRIDFSSNQPGEFGVMNALAVIKTAEFLRIPLETVKKVLQHLTRIPGRAERIEAGQNYLVVVDYAHTPDSLEALYKAYGNRRKVCVLGNTGGGRDKWKRPAMGKIADQLCDEVILTNEDPYDEDPQSILLEMKKGMQREPKIILGRREAIRHAFSIARPGDAVLITGKGTDPFIMGPRGSKIPWSDASVAREELTQLANEKKRVELA